MDVDLSWAITQPLLAQVNFVKFANLQDPRRMLATEIASQPREFHATSAMANKIQHALTSIDTITLFMLNYVQFSAARILASQHVLVETLLVVVHQACLVDVAIMVFVDFVEVQTAIVKILRH